MGTINTKNNDILIFWREVNELKCHSLSIAKFYILPDSYTVMKLSFKFIPEIPLRK